MRDRIFLAILCVLLLSACAGTVNPEDLPPTPTPLPTSSAPRFPVVQTEACQLAKYQAMRTRLPQGDLLAWGTKENTLAFVGPAAQSNWFTGTLYSVTAPAFQNPQKLSGTTLVYGSLSWSPDDSRIAYVSFHQPERYALSVSQIRSAAASEIASSAIPSDGLDSSRVIEGWSDAQSVRMLVSCGVDCDQTWIVNIQDGSAETIGEQLRRARSRMWPRPLLHDYDPEEFPQMFLDTWADRLSPQMKEPTWTEDAQKVAYIDRFLTAWVLRVDQEKQYMLYTPQVDAQELKWSRDGRYLALRTDDDVWIYDTECAGEAQATPIAATSAP